MMIFQMFTCKKTACSILRSTAEKGPEAEIECKKQRFALKLTWQYVTLVAALNFSVQQEEIFSADIAAFHDHMRLILLHTNSGLSMNQTPPITGAPRKPIILNMDRDLN